MQLQKHDPKQPKLLSFFKAKDGGQKRSPAQVEPQPELSTMFGAVVNSTGKIDVAFMPEDVQEQVEAYREQKRRKLNLERFLGIDANPDFDCN